MEQGYRARCIELWAQKNLGKCGVGINERVRRCLAGQSNAHKSIIAGKFPGGSELWR